MGMEKRLLKTTTVYFTPEQNRRLRRVARRHRVTQSAIIRAAVDRAINELERATDAPADVVEQMRMLPKLPEESSERDVLKNATT